MVLSWTALFTILAALVPITGAAYKLLLIRYQKLWKEDIDKKEQEIDKAITKAVQKDRNECDRRFDQVAREMKLMEHDIVNQVDTKFELVRRDLDGLTDVIKELKVIIERYQELHIETKIEEARTGGTLEALSQRVLKLEERKVG
jgi:hypothetical protein